MDRLRLGLAVLCAAVTVLGLALGATLQAETHLSPDASRPEGPRPGAGNPILATALLVAGGATGLLMLLSPRPLAQRWGPGALAFAAAYILVNLVQTAWPNLIGVELAGSRGGTMHINLFAFNGPGLASVLLPIFGLLVAGLLMLLAAARTLLARPGAPRLADLLREHTASHALSLPFAAVAAPSLLRLTGELPGDQPMARLLLPALAAAILAVEALGLVKLWQLGRATQDGRWAPVAREAWQGLSRAEFALAATVAVLATLGLMLPSLRLDALAPGPTFSVTLQSHTQFLLLALVPVVPRLWQANRVPAALREAPPLAAGAFQHPLVWASYAAALLAFLLGALGAWAIPGALSAWVLATAPAAVLALLAGRRASASLPLLLAAFAWWAYGNHLTATFSVTQSALLQHGVPATVLVLARLAGLALAGTAAARLARLLGARHPPSLAIPLAMAVAVATMGIGLLELPLDIWLVSTFNGQSVALGTLLAAQDGTVQAVMHALSLLLGTAFAFALARLGRPEWFGRRPPMAARQRAPADGPTTS